MKSLLVAIIALGCLGSTGYAAEKWVKVTKESTNIVSIDKSSIKNSPGITGAWFKIEKMTEAAPIDGKTPVSMKIYQESYCTKNSTRAKEVVMFDQKKAVIGKASKPNSEWQDVTKGSKTEILFNALCEASTSKNKK